MRLAGVHALARLADEAPEDREDLVQMVIDVLCAYLRMPYIPRPEAPGRPVLPSISSTTAVDLSFLDRSDHDGAQREKYRAEQEEHRKQVLDFESFREVRHTIIRIIGDHLRKPTRWRDKDYDFTGVVFDGGDLADAVFSGSRVSFREAQFTGGRVEFHRAEFTGEEVSFLGARFIGGTVNFIGTRFTDGIVNFNRAEFIGGRVNFIGARFIGERVSFVKARFTGGTVNFRKAWGTRPAGVPPRLWPEAEEEVSDADAS